MSKKNILFIMTDQHRYDYTGYSGYNKINTPNIDRIAQGSGFSCCQSTNPICAPARTSLITGKYSHQIGTLTMFGDLSKQMRTYMQVLQEEAYYTGAVGKLHYLQPWPWDSRRGRVLDLVGLKEQIKEFGFDELWECAGKQLMLRDYCDYSAHLEKKGILDGYLDFVERAGENKSTANWLEDAEPFPYADEDYVDVMIGEQSLEFLKNRPKDQPFYLFTSFCGPHKPFDPPKSYLDRVLYEEVDDFIEKDRRLTIQEKKALWKKRQAYKAMILLIDDQIGRLLHYLEEENLLKDTVIIFTSDHGEMMGDHYLLQKGNPYKEASTEPLAIRHPDYLNNQRCNSPVSLLDLAATILDIAEIDIRYLRAKNQAFSSAIPAVSLLPILKGEKEQVREYTFTEFDGKWQMLQTKEWKYIKYLQTEHEDILLEELYDLKEDPQECKNIASFAENLKILQWFRNRREYVVDHTPACQTMWAPICLYKDGEYTDMK